MNTFTLGASDFSPPDIITIAETLSKDAVVRMSGPGTSTFFVAAAINIGAARQIIVRPEISGISLPLNLLVCESDPSTATCITPPSPSVIVKFPANVMKTFTISVGTDAGSVPIPFDPASNRIQLNFFEGSTLRANSAVAVATNGAVAPPDDPDMEGGSSPLGLSLDNVNANGFNAMTTPIRMVAAAGSLDTTAGAIEVFINGIAVDLSNIAVSTSSIVVSQPLADGLNEIRVTGRDGNGDHVDEQFSIWAGSNSLGVNVVDEAGNPVADARVQFRLNEDEDIFVQLLTDAAGFVSAENIPGRPINLYAYAPNLVDSASTSVFGSAGGAVLTVRPLAAPSTVDNNDLQLGTTDGWIVSPGTTVVLHEGEPDAPMAGGTDYDIMAYTNGSEEKATVVRSIEVPGAPGEEVSYNFRHRFITTEVPGGYCGTQFNDAYGVEVRVVLAGGQPLEPQRIVNSMNGLGCSAFDANGATGWMDFQLSAPAGATLEVTGFVQNIGDALFQSWLVIDGLGQPPLKVSALSLKDFVSNKLEHFSVATTLTPGVPHLAVKGLLRIERVDPQTTATASNIVLKIKQGDREAEGQLTAAAAAALIGKPIPAGGALEWNSSKDLLFTVPEAQFAGWDTSLTANVSLSVELTPSEGKKSERDNSPKTVKVVTRSASPPIGRYGTRDTVDIPATKEKNVGGDDWMKQGTVDFIESLSGDFTDMTFNDSAKMHAGKFEPHTGAGHTNGTAVDMKFPGFPNQENASHKDATHAARIISLVQTYGSQLGTILTTFPTTDGGNLCSNGQGQSLIDLNSAFYIALETAQLANAQNTGRVQCYAKHGHIHVEVKNIAAPSPSQDYKVAVRKLGMLAQSARP